MDVSIKDHEEHTQKPLKPFNTQLLGLPAVLCLGFLVFITDLLFWENQSESTVASVLAMVGKNIYLFNPNPNPKDVNIFFTVLSIAAHLQLKTYERR